ncbi:hypothetical protein [Pseudomonas extremaustralis]
MGWRSVPARSLIGDGVNPEKLALAESKDLSARSSYSMMNAKTFRRHPKESVGYIVG